MIDIIKSQLEASKVLGFNLSEIEQGSAEWHRSRAGVVSASKAGLFLIDDAIAPLPENIEIGKVGKENIVVFDGDEYRSSRKSDCVDWVRNKIPRVPSDMKLTYMNELIAAIATCRLPDELSAKPLAWGKENEESAREAFSAATFEIIKETPFIYKDSNMRIGISPDGLIDGENKGLELKCPYNSGVWVAFAGQGKIKKDEVAQVQFSLWVTDAESWYFAKYDPRNINCKKLHYVEIKRDDEIIKKIELNVNKFIIEMDKSLENLGMKFGQQWGDSND